MSGGKKRLSVDVAWPVHEQLLTAALEDGCGPTTRLRVLAELWAEDEDLQRRAAQRVRHQRQRLLTRRESSSVEEK